MPAAAPELPGQPSSRGFLTVLLAHKGKALAFFSLVTLTVAVATWVSPDIYRSEARLMLRLGRENATLDPTAAGGQTVAISQTRRDEINSELEIFRNRETVERVVDAVGPGVDAARVGERVWVYEAHMNRPFGTAAQWGCESSSGRSKCRWRYPNRAACTCAGSSG